jgi:hypothetical protein
MPQTKAIMGIDWGTHSSKWSWSWIESDLPKAAEGRFNILRSEVCLDDEGKLFLSSDAPLPEHKPVRGIKGKLIKNPDAAFWEGPQKKIKMTLGELVTFSLWYFLGESYLDLLNTVGTQPSATEIRFSLPNWVDIDEGAVGRACYEQAAKIACHIFAVDREAWSRNARATREEWRSRVNESLTILGISDDSEIDDNPQGFRMMLGKDYPSGGGVSFRFVSESSAAGLAGIRRSEMSGGGLKLLVIDVGAGSTDVGYVIRAIPPKEERVKETLCQLPPANTCQTAGEALTNRIVEIYRSRGKNITFDEAETIKTTGADTDWLTHSAVDEWIRSIADHVRAYVLAIPDLCWLPYAPGLQVLITGGSGIVPGLREKIISAVTQALRERRVSGDVINETKSVNLMLNGPGAKEANRLAVVLGAADPNLPKGWYTQKIDPPMLHPTVHVNPSWTGS